MSQNASQMLESAIAKVREMVDVNSVIGTPITTADGVTIIPVSKVSVGFGGGGSDYVSKNANKLDNHPFGGGAGGGGIDGKQGGSAVPGVVRISKINHIDLLKSGNARHQPLPA